jgi:hypothetical protein
MTHHSVRIKSVDIDIVGKELTTTNECSVVSLCAHRDELHLRYDLGLVPLSIDDKYHNLKVKLTDVVRHHYGNVILRYRAGYVPSLRIGRFPGFDEPLLTDADVGATLGRAVKSPVAYTDIQFDVTAKVDSADSSTAKFTLKVNETTKETRAACSRACNRASGVAVTDCFPCRFGLAVCISCEGRHTLLAGLGIEENHSTCRATSHAHPEGWLAPVPAQLQHLTTGEWHGCKKYRANCSGTRTSKRR